MDDDVTVESTWLRNLTAGVLSGEWAGAGGRILPRWPCAPPSWLPVKESFGKAPLAVFDRGPEAGRLTEPSNWHQYGFSSEHVRKVRYLPNRFGSSAEQRDS